MSTQQQQQPRRGSQSHEPLENPICLAGQCATVPYKIKYVPHSTHLATVHKIKWTSNLVIVAQTLIITVTFFFDWKTDLVYVPSQSVQHCVCGWVVVVVLVLVVARAGCNDLFDCIKFH